MEPEPALHEILVAIASRLGARGEPLVLAESLTGGGLGQALTALPGASAWFLGSVVAYADATKRDWLGVPEEVLGRFGAVSEDVVRALLAGLRARSTASWMMATSGYAGPEGDPPGRVYIGWDRRMPGSGLPRVRRFDFGGDRESVRRQTVEAALRGLLYHLDEP